MGSAPRPRRSRTVPEPATALEVVGSLVRLLRRAAAGGDGALTLTQLRLLLRLAEGTKRTSDLAEELEVTAATVSAAIDGLVRRGLVERLERGDDRRTVPLRATARGQTVVAEARAREEAALVELWGALRPGERRALAVALRGLARVLGVRTPGAR